MKSIINAVAGGRNLLVLLVFSIIGFSLVITPPLETLNDAGKSVIAFGWNAIAALLVVGFFRLINNFQKSNDYDKLSWYYPAFVCGLAAVIGILLT